MGVSDLGNQTGAVVKDGEIVNIYLDKYAKPIISCADALTGIRFLGNLSEMIAGKNIAVVSGELTKTYEVSSPAPANILDQLNVEFRDFFAIATDADGWIVDTLNATVTDDTRVSITPVQNNDWSLATWKSDIYVDRRDVEHGLNTTLLQDGGSLNFCMSLYAAIPEPRCHTFTPQQITNLKNRSTGLTTLYKGKYPIGDNYMTINGQHVETSTVDGKLVIADNPYVKVETLVDNKPAFSRKTTTLAGKIVVRICSGFPIEEADTPFWGMEDDGMIGAHRGYRDADGYETAMFVFNTPQDVPNISCADATENVLLDINYTQDETPRFSFKLNNVAQNYLYNDPLSPLVVTPETPLTGPMTLSLNPAYDFGADTTIRFMNFEFEYGNTLDDSTATSLRKMLLSDDNTNPTAVRNTDRSFNFCLAKPSVDPGISCEGALPFTSEISLDGKIGFAWDTGEYVEYDTPEDLVAALKAKDLDVDIIVDPEPPEDEITEIFMDNNAIAVPFDGSKTYVMDATIIRDGVETPTPIVLPISSPPFAEGVLDHDPIALLLWFSQLAQAGEFAGIQKWFTSILMSMSSPAEANDLPSINFTGNKANEVLEEDVIQIRFAPKSNLAANEVDYYNLILKSRYPDGVTITSHGPLKTTLIDRGRLSDNDITFAYRWNTPQRGFGVRKFDPETLAYKDLDLTMSQAMLDATNVGVMNVSKDGKLVVGLIDANDATDVIPVYGWAIDGESNTLLDFVINDGIDIPVYAMRAAISPDNKRVIVSQTPNNDFYIFDQDVSNQTRYVCSKVIKSYDVIETGMMDIYYVGDQLVARGYAVNGVKYFAVELTGSTGLGMNILSSVTVNYTDGYVMSEDVAIHGDGLLDAIKGKLIYIDVSNPAAITSKEVYTYPDELPASGNLYGEITNFGYVGTAVKALYTVIAPQETKTTVFDWDPVNLTATAPKTRVDAIRTSSINKFSNSKGIFCYIKGNANPEEFVLRLNAVNGLDENTLPLSP